MIAVLLLCILLQFEKLRGQCVGSPTYTTCGSSCQICQAQCEGWFCIEACETGNYCASGTYYSANLDCCLTDADCAIYDSACITSPPTNNPVFSPTSEPSSPTNNPTFIPSSNPSLSPTDPPTTGAPTEQDETSNDQSGSSTTEDGTVNEPNEEEEEEGSNGGGSGNDLDYSLIFIIAACAIFCPFVILAVARCIKRKIKGDNKNNNDDLDTFGTGVNIPRGNNGAGGNPFTENPNMEGKTNPNDTTLNETDTPGMNTDDKAPYRMTKVISNSGSFDNDIATNPLPARIAPPNTMGGTANADGEGYYEAPAAEKEAPAIAIAINSNSGATDDDDSELRYVSMPETKGKESDVQVGVVPEIPAIPDQPQVQTKGGMFTPDGDNISESDNQIETRGNEDKQQ